MIMSRCPLSLSARLSGIILKFTQSKVMGCQFLKSLRSVVPNLGPEGPLCMLVFIQITIAIPQF
uniref:Uncharacterized protein n=1 Tax=Anguilla anguilla TaxID=7936 RepID=A0A0E9VUD0_ANGAN